jgi:transcription antitermination factor NusG
MFYGDRLSPAWFAFRTRTNHEKVTQAALMAKTFDSFLPLYRERRVWSDRIKEIEIPLFPGYLFCWSSVEEHRHILNTPGVMSVVGSGRHPIAIPDAEMENVKQFVASEIDSKPYPFLEVGQRVRLVRGPLAGVEGVLKEFKTGYRLIVSVTLLQRSIAAELDASWIEVAPKRNR